jgi:hypothetical protein
MPFEKYTAILFVTLDKFTLLTYSLTFGEAFVISDSTIIYPNMLLEILATIFKE